MSTRHTRRWFPAAIALGALALAACGGGTDDGGDAAGADPGDGAAAADVLPEVADAVEVDPAADVPTNLMPDLVVDHLNDRNKVNVRNFAVGDKPTLLWMWAPH